jgi:hypothetical protein
MLGTLGPSPGPRLTPSSASVLSEVEEPDQGAAASAGPARRVASAPRLLNSLQPDHFGRWMILERVARIHHQLRALQDRGVIEAAVIGYYHHAVGLRG